jgi:hypothetical protein
MVLAARSFVAAVALAGFAGPSWSEVVETRGTIDAVTVYRGQARVARLVSVPPAQGLHEIVVTDLPEHVLPGSLAAEHGGADIEIRSIGFRSRPVSEERREDVRAIEAKIRVKQDAIDAVVARQSFFEWQRQFLDKIETFTAATAQVEHGKGVLDPDRIATMTALVTDRRSDLVESGRAAAIELRTLTEERDVLARELQELAARTSRTAREAVILVHRRTAAKAGSDDRLRVHYLVERATWSPSYNLRSTTGSDEVVVEYLASVEQTSGEDWQDVAVTISTATPALVSAAPSLEPLGMTIVAQATEETGQWRDRAYADVKRELDLRQRDAETGRMFNNAGQAAVQQPSGQSQAELDKCLNDMAAKNQLLDVVTTANVANRSDRAAAIAGLAGGDEGISVLYAIPARTSVRSRSGEQMLQIAQFDAPAVFGKVATPVLTGYVYDEATVVNASDLVLLAGPSSSTRNGEFVGRGTLPTISAGESFTAGFGIDTSLRASRELLERTESIQGGNRVVEFAYRLSIENFGPGDAKVRLLDRVPQPESKDIRLTMLSTGGPDHPLVVRSTPERGQEPRPDGILRWDLAVPGGPQRTTALEYRFRIEHDKQMAIALK